MRRHAQALVELALVTPLLAMLALGLVGVARLQVLRVEVDAVARETARAAVLQPLPASPAELQSAEDTARTNAMAYGRQVAAGYGHSIQPDVIFPEEFQRGSLVRGHAELTVNVGELVALGGFAPGATPSVKLTGDDLERVDKFRSLVE